MEKQQLSDARALAFYMEWDLKEVQQCLDLLEEAHPESDPDDRSNMLLLLDREAGRLGPEMACVAQKVLARRARSAVIDAPGEVVHTLECGERQRAPVAPPRAGVGVEAVERFVP